MMKVTLPILYYAEGNTLTELGLSEGTKTVKQQIFYSIDSLAPVKNETYIYSGGETFVCPKPIHEVSGIIDKASVSELLIFKNN